MLVPAHTVDVVAAKVIAVVHKVVGHAAALQLLNAAVLAPPAQADLKIDHMGHLALIFVRNHAVLGQNDPYIMPLLGQRRGQGAHHISQAARFDKGHAFAGCEQNFHGLFLLLVGHRLYEANK